MRRDFVFQNFEPRIGVRSYANDLLKEMLDDFEGNFSCRAVIAQKEQGFSFSVVVGQGVNMYSTDSFVSYVKCLNSGREWQRNEVKRLVHDLEVQIQQWLKMLRKAEL